MGMNGIDGKFALLKLVRAHQCVNRKKLTANSFENAVSDLKAFAREQLEGVIAAQFAQRAVYAFA